MGGCTQYRQCGRPLRRAGGDLEALEGDLPTTRTVILEFPSRQAALDWYLSDSYQEIRKLREGAAQAVIYVVDEVV